MDIKIDPIFKFGDRVYHCFYGWGIITALGNNVVFDIQPNVFVNVNFEKKLLSFT